MARKTFERVWRSLSHLASERGHLYSSDVKMEVRVTMWVYDKGGSKSKETITAVEYIDFRGAPPKKGMTLWDYLKGSDEVEDD